MRKQLFTVLTLTSISISIYAQNPLDITFGSNGKAITNINGYEDDATAMAIQSDGKIVVAGSKSDDANGSSWDCVLVRYNTDGTLDNSFGTGGKVITDFGNDFEGFNCVAIQADGKIIAGGATLYGDPNFSDFLIARYNSDGSVDNTFGTGGKTISNFGDDGGIASIAIQSDGKIVAGGFSGIISLLDEDYDFAVLRYNTNGTLDNTFDGDGQAVTDFLGENDWGKSVQIQSDGKIVLSGYALNPSTPWDVAVARYNTNGTLDNTFSTDGKVMTDLGSSTLDWVNASALQSDGKIVVVGYHENGNNDDVLLVRYNTDGSLDNTFDSDGMVISQIGNFSDRADAVTIDTSGKIVITGTAFVTGIGYGAMVARYNTNGSLDNTFGIGGYNINVFSALNDVPKGIAIQTDGRIVIAGKTPLGGTSQTYDFMVARYNIDGVLATTELFAKKFSLYPNPVAGTLFIDGINNDAMLSVFDATGRLIQSQKILAANGSRVELPVAGLAKGMYVLQINEKGNTAASTFIVE